MDKADILEKIKTFFFEEKNYGEKKKKMEEIVSATSDWKSGDKIVRVEGEVLTGTPVKEVTENGLETLLDGEYVIDDAGITLVVTDGIIAEIKEEAQTSVEIEADEEIPVENEMIDVVVLKEEIGTIIKEVAEEILQELETVKAENIELKARFEKFANQDSGQSVSQGKEKKTKFEDKYEKLKYYGKR